MKCAQLPGVCLLLSLVASVATAAEVMAPPPPGAANPRLQLEAPSLLPDSAGSYLLPRWQDNDVTGSLDRFGKYVTPPQGVYVDRLRIERIRPDSSLDFDLLSPGQPAARAHLRWQNLFPSGNAEVLVDRYRFHLYPGSGNSIRQNWIFAGAAVLADGKSRLQFRSHRTGVEIRKPGDDVNFGATHMTLGISRPLGSSDADAEVMLRSFGSSNGLQPHSYLFRYRLGYTANLPGLSSIGASYARAEVNQLGQRPKVEMMGLAATSPAVSNLVATARFDTRRVLDPVQRTTFTRSSNAMRFDLSLRALRGLSLRAGYDRREFDRVNRLQSNTDEIVWNTLWASASYRPTRRWQLLARAQTRNNPTPPFSGLSDPIPLVMNQDRSADVRLQGTPFDNTVVYMGASTRYRKNTRRNVELEQDTTAIGAWTQIGQRLSLNADYSILWADSRNLPVLAYLSDARVTTVGGGYTFSPRLYLDGSYSHYKASRAQNISQDVFGVTARRQLPRGASWYLEFRRDIYRDRGVPSQSYTANVLSMGGSGRF